VRKLHTVALHTATTPETPAFTPPPPRRPRPSLNPVPFLYSEQICYHVIDKYHYAGSIDIKLIGQAI
jgi:hypothetical protein